MKNIFKLLFATAVVGFIFSTCSKVGNLPTTTYANGTASVLTSSVTAVAAQPSDSNSIAITFNWSNPKYATDSATQKFVIEFDTTSSFATPVTFTLTGALSDSFTAKQLNNILLGFGFGYNTQHAVSVMVVSSYGNNNEQINSNTLTLQMTPYKTPPKVPVPANLYIVGDAIGAPGSGWSNPVDTPYQKLTQIDSVTFGGIFNIVGGNSYLLLPLNGDWTHKYSVADNTVSGLSAGGSFNEDLADNIPAPATSGWYKIIVNFQSGTFTVTPYTGVPLPVADAPTPSTLATGLWIIGDATPENPSWTNDAVSLAKQKFTQLSNGEFQLSIALNSTGSYLFLPAAGDWNNKYGGASATGGTLLYDGSVPGSNTPGPATSGNYLIDVNFVTDTYTLTPQ